jgi:hypothetical protein
MKTLTTIPFVCLLLLYSCKNEVKKVAVVQPKKDSIKKKQFVTNTLGNVKYVKWVTDTKALLKMFFAPDTIINREAWWKPDPDAQVNMQVGDDGYCRTVVDTVIYPEKDKSVCVVIFLTGSNDIGWAKLDVGKEGYTVSAFKKYVFWSDCTSGGDCFSVVKYGSDDYAVQGGFCIMDGYYNVYYDATTADRILGYCASFGRMGYSTDQYAKFVKGQDDMKDVRITGTSIDIDEKTHHKTRKKIDRHFKWNFERMQYVEVLNGNNNNE